jgi:capsular exopolysaccharide synthesis family protein
VDELRPPASSRSPLDEGSFMQLRDYVTVLRARKWTFLAVTGAIVILGALFSLTLPSDYQSTATILLPDPADTDVRTGTEGPLALSPPVAQAAARELGGISAQEVLERVTATVVTDTQLLQITFSADDPTRAQRGAQAMAQAYLEFRTSLETDTAAATVGQQIESLTQELRAVATELAETPEGPQQLALEARLTGLAGQIAQLQGQLARIESERESQVGQLVAPASAPEAAGPGLAATALASLLAGLVVGAIAAFLLERAGDRIRRPVDLEAAARAQVLAVIPRIAGWKDGQNRPPVVVLSDPGSPASEAYRALRAALGSVATHRQLATLLVTSPTSAEGKSGVVSNVGVVLAQAGIRVTVCSADFRHPMLHRFFGAANKEGLSDVLTGSKRPADVLKETDVPGLFLMPSGPPLKGPTDVLGSPVMSRVLAQLDADSDLVLLDAPPVLAGADAIELAGRVDGVLLVASAVNSRRAAVALARQRLDQVDATVVGAVLNEAERSGPLETLNGG